MSITKISLITQNKIPKTFKTKTLKTLLPLSLVSFKSSLRPQPIKDSLELQTIQPSKEVIFINDIIKGEDKETDTVLKSYNFKKHVNKGIPLLYSRKNFIKDINTSLKEIPLEEQKELLKKYHLRLGNNDIDGIAILPKTEPKNDAEKNICKAIEKYYNNETKIKDKKANRILNKFISGMPEFNMTIGKKQHHVHIYSVDIHSLFAMQNALKNPEYENLTEEGKAILKLSMLMHDFGKNGNEITKGHAKQSKKDAKAILERYILSSETKARILNLIENHHWFENFNKGKTTESDIKQIFKTSEDLEIAKIMAKADLESINPSFHRKIICPDKVLTQEEFDEQIKKKMSNLKY